MTAENFAVYDGHRELPEKELHLKEALDKLLGPQASEYYRLGFERLASVVEGNGRYIVLKRDEVITGVVLFFGPKKSDEGLRVGISANGFVIKDRRGEGNKTEIVGHSKLIGVRHCSLPEKAIMALATGKGSIVYLGYDEMRMKTGNGESVVKLPAVIEESLP